MRAAIKKGLDLLYQKTLSFNNPFYFFGIARNDYRLQQNSITLTRLGITFRRQEGEDLLQGYPFAIKIHERLGGRFRISSGELYLDLQDLTFRINSSEEIFILFEVFVTGDYRNLCTRDSVFVDVGMNSGITSLYYARQPFVRKVYAFELFAPTFALGKRNILLNQQFSSKFDITCFGLSNKDFETTLDYSLSRKGRMGLKGLPKDENFIDVTKEAVVVKDAKNVFRRIIDASAGFDIIVKIDCEGEEYNIIATLAEAGLLEKLTVLMIEWHFVLPTALEEQLKTAGFYVFSQTLPSLDSGMIYASKRPQHS